MLDASGNRRRPDERQGCEQYNQQGGFHDPYQAGVSDSGNNDKVIANRISGLGYDPSFVEDLPVDADPSATNRAKVHANK